MILTDESVDRDGDIIRAAGVDWSRFASNPVVLCSHEHKSLPVGRIVNLRQVPSPISGHPAIVGDLELAKPGVSAKADEARGLIEGGILKACSVGFIPRKIRTPGASERRRLGMPSHGRIYEESELIELSLCSVPSNANALLLASMGDRRLRNLIRAYLLAC